jgi:MT0933-like antitoxin protein
MGFGDKFKDLAKQAQGAVAERKEQIAGAVDRASVVADQKTGGKYSEQIAKAGQKATGVVEKLAGETDTDTSGQAPTSGEATAGGPAEPAAAPTPAETPPAETPPPAPSAPPAFE